MERIVIASPGFWSGTWKTHVVETNSGRISDIEIWRAANQVIKLHPVEPELAACQRADAAYAAGDMFNFHLWQKIAKAVRELIQTKPTGDNGLN